MTSLRFSEKVLVGKASLTEYLEFAKHLAVQAGDTALNYFRVQEDEIGLTNKSLNAFDPVTKADKEIEAKLRNLILEHYPKHGIFGEEEGYFEGNGLTWVIDPIDGTRAYMSGLLHWGVLVALFDGTRPILGVMYQPYTSELFFGDGNCSYISVRGEKPKLLKSSSIKSFSDTVFATDTLEVLSGRERSVAERSRLVRLGGDCYVFSMLAMGLIHVVFEKGLKPYDIQALIPVIEGAGGVVTTLDGGNPSLGGSIVATANPELHEDVLRQLT